MIVYFAGGFEREEEQMSVCKKHGLPFYRLLSFFYKKDVENYFLVMKKLNCTQKRQLVRRPK